MLDPPGPYTTFKVCEAFTPGVRNSGRRRSSSDFWAVLRLKDTEVTSWYVTLNVPLFLLFCTEYRLHSTVRSSNYFFLVLTFLFCPYLFNFTCFFVADLTIKCGHVALTERVGEWRYMCLCFSYFAENIVCIASSD